jgi:hypothetical protein
MPVKIMASPASSAAAMTSSSRIGTAGLDHGRRARLGGCQQAVGEGEERVGGENGALGRAFRQAQRLGHVLGLAGGDAAGIDAAHLARADAHRGAVPSRRRWRWTSRAWPPTRQRSCPPFPRRGVAARDGAQLLLLDAADVLVLHQKAARHLPVGQRGLRGGGQAAGGQKAQVLLRREDRLAPRSRPGRSRPR